MGHKVEADRWHNDDAIAFLSLPPILHSFEYTEDIQCSGGEPPSTNIYCNMVAQSTVPPLRNSQYSLLAQDEGGGGDLSPSHLSTLSG